MGLKQGRAVPERIRGGANAGLNGFLPNHTIRRF
jgi:hypothetical protein